MRMLYGDVLIALFVMAESPAFSKTMVFRESGSEAECPSDTTRLHEYPVIVQTIRRLLAQRHLAVLICAATLLLKLLVPTGYMIASDHGRFALTICSGTAPAAATMDMPGMHGDMPDHRKPKDHGKAEMPCAFSGLSAAILGPIDPIQLAALIAFVLAIGLTATVPPAPSQPAFLRPPLRGPPIYL
ncbi:DUF2946 family protein [Sphingomonas montana]|uniref:DUF2946 family protein n=1 Tax=Sphingomonas montana TaxID=1843236 RepID=UPI001F0B34EC|nr:DUF2946 family protein [Sphingomonas montana]